MRRCAFATFGCKVNQYETQAIREAFLRRGFIEVEFGEESDIYVINTCTVTDRADSDSVRAIRSARRSNPAAKVMVTGCLAELDFEKLRSIQGVSCVVRNSQKHLLPDMVSHPSGVDGFSGRGSPDTAFMPFAISWFKGHSRAFLKVQDGCDNSCSYCKVPLVRGRSRSRGEKDIVEEAQRLAVAGFKEIVLTGICLGGWRGPRGGSLAAERCANDRRLEDLLDKICSVTGDFRIRLSSIEPGDVTSGLLERIKNSSRICPHLHMPVQSGDDDVLRRMNRAYTRDLYKAKIDEIRSFARDISLTTDVLLGFPGEGEENFDNTVSLVEYMRPSRVHIFSYSPRPGTAAYDLKGRVPSRAVYDRRKRLGGITAKIAAEYRSRFLNKTAHMLVEAERDPDLGLLTGYDERYIRVYLDGPDSLKGRIVKVEVKRVRDDGLEARLSSQT